MKRARTPSLQMRTLLATLAASGSRWRHGYDIIVETGLLSGTLYPLLVRMADQGLLESEWQAPTVPGKPPRHAYRLTAEGFGLAASLRDTPTAARHAPGSPA